MSLSKLNNRLNEIYKNSPNNVDISNNDSSNAFTSINKKNSNKNKQTIKTREYSSIFKTIDEGEIDLI